MPPRKSSNRGGPRAERVQTTLSLGSRHSDAGRGSGPGGTPSTAATQSSTPSHITTVGVKRPNFGTAGRAIQLQVNSFPATVPTSNICHYDVVEPKLSARKNLKLFEALQDQETAIFTPRIVYDGQKNAFAPRELAFGEANARKFNISFARPNTGGNVGRPPRVYSITLTKVASITTEVLHRYVDGLQSHSETVLTAIMALNVVMRMQPNLSHPFTKRSFFTDQDRRPIGGGYEAWRGIFQSIRPAIGQLVVNIDLATTLMYKEGPLINLCNEFFGKPPNANPSYMSPAQNFPDRQRSLLKKFLTGVDVTVSTTGVGRPRRISGLSTEGANTLSFTDRQGNNVTVAQYFNQVTGRPLRFSTVICVMIGQAAIPLEACSVIAGQFINKELPVPPEQVKKLLEFATIRPSDRLERIKQGMKNIQYGQSDYVQQFGMKIDPQPLTVPARILEPINLKYRDAKGALVNEKPRPGFGAWNMLDKKFYTSAKITYWAIIIYESQQRFPESVQQEMIKEFLKACNLVGLRVEKPNPLVKFEHGHGVIANQIRAVGAECVKQFKVLPSLVVVILPEGGSEIYTAVKHFGDMVAGVPTQCLKSNNCKSAKPQYWANVMLKINGKLGGINAIPDPQAIEIITDPAHPAIVIGADVIHPPPGATGRPSFTAVVGSIDSNGAKYVATSRVQVGRQEIIDDLKEMCKEVIKFHMLYHEKAEKKGKQASIPKKLIFYRDGVSEGQFQQVLDKELPLIKEACKELDISPKITLIIVGKRHHNQFFPGATANIADKSGNAPAGTVVDRVITHPTDFDFILQSHAGILGTSRPAHYSVLYDESRFNADSLQKLSFALCHVYAPSTRSVSIPAPVYYADRVCGRAKTHFDPSEDLNLSDTATQASATEANLEAYKTGFKSVHANQQINMYFC